MTQKTDCFNAFGQPVPEPRKLRTQKLIEEHCADLQAIERDFILSVAIEAIEKDRLANLWSDLRRYVSQTFYYMIIAHLCADEGHQA